ncbi:MAG: menaquinone-dependent protoporphyrinogen IX dehydrogenase, partial [Pseudomonadota bacterium]
ILILYSSVDGHTLKICRRIAARLEQAKTRVTIIQVDEVESAALSDADKIVIGASVRYGRHRPAVHRLVEANRGALTARPTAFFSVNLSARKPDKNSLTTNPYLGKFLSSVDWQPDLAEVFAGVIDYPSYRWSDRLFIRFIMWMTKGPTGPSAQIEYTDWNQVDRFADRCLAL